MDKDTYCVKLKHYFFVRKICMFIDFRCTLKSNTTLCKNIYEMCMTS